MFPPLSLLEISYYHIFKFYRIQCKIQKILENNVLMWQAAQVAYTQFSPFWNSEKSCKRKKQANWDTMQWVTHKVEKRMHKGLNQSKVNYIQNR